MPDDSDGKVIPLFEIIPDEQNAQEILREAMEANYTRVLILGEKHGDLAPEIHSTNDWRPDDLWMLKQAERKLLSEEN